MEATTVRGDLADLGYARRDLVGARPPNLGVPCEQELDSRGELLVTLLELERIPDDDLLGVQRLLWQSFGHEPPG